jgi:hypothetical protein
MFAWISGNALNRSISDCLNPALPSPTEGFSLVVLQTSIWPFGYILGLTFQVRIKHEVGKIFYRNKIVENSTILVSHIVSDFKHGVCSVFFVCLIYISSGSNHNQYPPFHAIYKHRLFDVTDHHAQNSPCSQ